MKTNEIINVCRVNIIYFPESRPHPLEGVEEVPWTPEVKQRFYQQQGEIHMINIGPVTQDILDSRLIDADFNGVVFTWTKETSEYVWTYKNDGASKPLPLKYIGHLLAELRKVGYHSQDTWSRNRPTQTDTYKSYLTKQVYHLEKRFWISTSVKLHRQPENLSFCLITHC